MAAFNEKAPQCSCKEDKVAYICTDTKCKNNTSQLLYCQNCFDIGKHPHFPQVQIHKVVKEMDEKWVSLREDSVKVDKSAKQKYNDLKPLITYLEQEMIEVPVSQMQQPKKSIAADIAALEKIVAKTIENVKALEEMVSKG